eukprot:Em0020g481a
MHISLHNNGTHGIVVAIAAGTTAGRNSNAASRAVPGVQLPAECGPPTYAQCNTTVVYYYPGDGNLTLLIPVVGGVLILTYYYDPGAGWSPTPTEPCVLKVLGCWPTGPQLSVVTAVVVFADGNGVYMASMSQTAPQPFLRSLFRAKHADDRTPLWNTNGEDTFSAQNGTVTQPIVLGQRVRSHCVNAKDPQFVYRHGQRFQSLCSGLDFTEHEGSFFVGFFDGLTYKMANLSCPGEAPAVVGVAFRPDLSTSFVGPDEQRCLCFPQAPTLPPSPSSSLSAVIIGATSASAIGVAAGVVILIVVLRKKCKAQYDSLPTQPEGNEEPQQETEECSNRNGATDLENHRVNAPAFPESREQHNHSALAMSNDPLLPNTSTNHDFA